MTWIIRWNGKEHSSDDFTIADLGAIEKATGTPWSTCNVLRDVKVARAFLAVVMLHEGASEDEVADALGKVTLRTLKSAFEWRVDGEEEEHEEVDPSAQPPNSTSVASSIGGGATAGSPAIPASSG